MPRHDFITGVPGLSLLQRALRPMGLARREAPQHRAGAWAAGHLSHALPALMPHRAPACLPAKPRLDRLCHARPWERPDSRDVSPESLDLTARDLWFSVELGNPESKEEKVKKKRGFKKKKNKAWLEFGGVRFWVSTRILLGHFSSQSPGAYRLFYPPHGEQVTWPPGCGKSQQGWRPGSGATAGTRAAGRRTRTARRDSVHAGQTSGNPRQRETNTDRDR